MDAGLVADRLWDDNLASFADTYTHTSKV
jgi:hypothetical protein